MQYRLKKYNVSYPKLTGESRIQNRIPAGKRFPCNIQQGRSLVPPDNVHKLRPGDIDIIGALGDSLIAGSGALEEYAIGTFIEDRGVSWCAGGQSDWRVFLTVPNIIKEFNRNLQGYSTGTGQFRSNHAGLNIAFPVAAAEDALVQARILVKRIKENKKMDFQNHWKLITILFGSNDVCSGYCYNQWKYSPAMYTFHLQQTLDYLQNNLPRTLVNLVPAMGSLKVKHGIMCNMLHPLYCSCLYRKNSSKYDVSNIIRNYQQAITSLVSSGRYDSSSNFTVVIQPFTQYFNAENLDLSNESILNKRMVTYDCFHFSQLGHSIAAMMLWNNMMEPVGRKSHKKETFSQILCPSTERPYIYTNINSKLWLRKIDKNNF